MAVAKGRGRKMPVPCGATGATAVCCFIIMALNKECLASPPFLEILPSQAVQTRPVGKSLLLTCRPQVDDNSLISDLQWRDNNNRTIEPASMNHPAMYTEMMPADMSIALFISSLTEAMAGTYHCSASYANTERLHVSVKIDAIVAITWKDAPEVQYPINGRDYRVKCDVSARPPPTVDWRTNGEPILTSGRYVLENRGLLIKNVTEADDGTYTCRASVMLTGELADKNIRLEVHTPPSMEPMPSVVEVLEGETATITCAAKGKPLPVYSWTKLNTQQDLATADRFSVNKHTGIVTITRVEQSDLGPFSCLAKNAAGDANHTFQVEVIVKPKIYELVNVTSPVTTETKLICKATGRPAPKISFKRYGAANKYFINGAQKDNERIFFDHEMNAEKGESIGTLTILKTERPDDGLYECMAENKGDKAYKSGHITVEFPPTFNETRNLLPIWSWNQKPANLSCIAESIPNATIEWRLNNQPLLEDRNIRIIGTGPTSNLLISPVENRYYTFYKCIATNKLGRAEQEVELRLARVPNAVLQSNQQFVTATSIKFTLMGPGQDFGPPLRAYIVQYKNERNNDWNAAKNKTWSVDSPYTIENLLPQTTYNFRFAAINDVGAGVWSANQVQTMPKRSFPEVPKILAGTTTETGATHSPYPDRYEVRWNIPADNGEIIDIYELKFCPVNKVNGEWSLISESDCTTKEIKAYENTQYDLKYLVPDTYYRISLRAHNLMGYSLSEEVYLKTARGADSGVHRHEGPALSSAAIIGIVIAGVLLMLLVVDLLLCCCRRQGVCATICNRKSKQHEEDEAKLGRDEKEPLKDCNDRAMIDGGMMRNTSVEFDGRRVHAKTGEIIGKNSAV